MTVPGKMLSTVTLNLRFGLADDGPNDWSNRFQAYPELMSAYPSDFFAFQEANDFQIDALSGILPDYRVVGIRPDAPDRWQHNPVFYRPDWTCVASDHFYLSTTPDRPSKDPDSRWPRQCTIGRFESNGQTVTIVNTHFDFDPSVQNRSARLIRNRLGGNPKDIPELVMGDFNAEPGSPPWRTFTEDTTLPGAPFSQAMPEPNTGTYHGFSGMPDGRVIDWVLYRGDVRPQWAKVIQDRFRGFHPSDHFPIVVHWAII